MLQYYYMTLDFEKLSEKVDEMARTAHGRMQTLSGRTAEVLAFMRDNATEWEAIQRQDEYVANNILGMNQPKPFRGSARPLNYNGHGLDSRFPFEVGQLPAEATIIAADGSQIVPDRHNPFVYYLVNIGGIVYHHGKGQVPETFTEPTLEFPEIDELESHRFNDYASVTIQRDLGEIDMLAFQANEYKRDNLPLLTMMDQRLLYVPTGEIAPQFKEQVVQEWQGHMQRIQQSGAWLAGYIDSPMKDSVVRMLRGIHPDRKQDDPNDLGEWYGLTDADLFSQLLAPGERSKLFMDVSFANNRFRKPNQVCFFYLNPGRFGQNIARVDLPQWVAQNDAAVAAIHALIYDQCQIMGNYPYVITRADEMAVVKRRDQEELEFRIGRKMDAYGVDVNMTAKAQTKEFARSDKRRHESF